MTVRSEIELLTQTKEEIRTAIVDKGQTLDTTAPMNPDYGNKIKAIPNSSTGVEHYTLKEVLEGTAETVFDDTIDYIRPYCFSGCDNLTSATFNSVLKIEQHAFDGCFCFKTIVLNTSYMVHLVNINAFKATCLERRRGNILVTESLMDTYRADEFWSHYSLNIKSIACAGLSPIGYLKANTTAYTGVQCVDLGWSSTTSFTGATVTNANLTNANFCNTDATNAILTNANLENCDAYNANLNGATLTGANLSGTVLVGADVSGTTCLAGANLANLVYGTDFIVEDNEIVYM